MGNPEALVNYTRRLTNDLYAYNSTFPNLQGLDVVPGTVLTYSGGRWTVRGNLDQFIETDAPLQARVRAAMDRIAPAAASPHGTTTNVSLSSSGTTIAAAKTGLKLVSVATQVAVDVQVVLGFSEESDYVFDTATPAAWFTFSPAEMKDIHAAALNHLQNGMYVITGAAWTPSWLYRISRKSSQSLGFTTTADVSALDIGHLADVSASASLNLAVDNAGSLTNERASEVACFSCIKRHFNLFGDKTGVAIALADGTVVSADTQKAVKAVLSDATPIDLEDDG